MASLLVGGEADLESGAQWPSLAVLFNVKRKASCTVTIFSPRWLVTSLTCVRDSLNPLEWVVFAGPSGYNPSASESAQIKLVKTILGHPESRRGQHLVTSDLALVEIHDGLSFNSWKRVSLYPSKSLICTCKSDKSLRIWIFSGSHFKAFR